MKKFLLLFFLIIAPLFAQESYESSVRNFLILGPVKVDPPAFADKEAIDLLMENEYIEPTKFLPSENEELNINGKRLMWETADSGKEMTGDKYSLVYYLFYIEPDRFFSAEMNIGAAGNYVVYIDGNKRGSYKDKEFKEQINLEPGQHTVLIKQISEKPEITVPEVKFAHKLNFEDGLFSTDPTHFTGVDELLDNPKTNGVSVSRDGKYAIVTVSQRNTKLDKTEKWPVLFSLADKKKLFELKGGMNFSSVDWSPVNNAFVYTTTANGKSSLWYYELESGSNKILLPDVEDLGGFTWSPEGAHIYYTISSKQEKEEKELRKFDAPQERYPWYGGKNSIYRMNIESGYTERLTGSKYELAILDISPGGNKILLLKNDIDFSARPYSKNTIYILNSETKKADSLFTLRWGSGAKWLNENQLIVTGAPSDFGGIGRDLPEGVIPNDYDAQLFLYDLNSNEAAQLTKDFDPSVTGVFNNRKNDGELILKVLDESYSRLYRLNINNKEFTRIETPVEMVENISFAENADVSVYTGSSSNVPEKVYVWNTKSGNHELLFDPDEEYEKIKLGDVKDFDFVSSAGNNVKGRVYYPPNFDESKKYPAIVYYYGGTSPVTREFEGRYPKNIWAANGYIVYVLQPTGAYGFGQEKSAYHVNDWGEVTAQEVIEGTDKFVEAHSFVDKNRLGCIGASYGGFMTLNIIAKTNKFAAAVSHAGISALTSYWGEGFWGFSYSAVATAEKFPWNAQDVYVEKSPIYNADKINTPLLLLHGNSDTNVPPGESRQMFAALKILGKDVTLIEVEGQDHHIMEYSKRKKWTKTIIAYFDKYLKTQPEWWDHLYEK